MVVIAVPPVYPATVTLTLRAFGVVHGARTSGPTRAGASSSTPTGRSGKIPGMVRLEANHGPAAVDDHAWNPAWDLGSDFIPKERYTTRAFTELEHTRLWPRTWQVACREEELAAPGAFVEYRIADQSILVVRSGPDEIRAYYNSCRHRGTRLAHGCGALADDQITCPFHGWRWNLDGSCAFVLDPDDFGLTSLDAPVLRLGELRCERRWGFVWVCADPEARVARRAPLPAPAVLRPVPPRGHAVPLVPHDRAARRTGRPRSTRSTRGTTTSEPIRSCCSGRTTRPCATSSSPTVTPAT